MSADTIPVQSEVVAEEVVDQAQEPVQQEAPAQEHQEEKVPLSALQKERRKRQDAEAELKWHKEQRQKPETPQEPDESLLEAATKQDLRSVRQQVLRDVSESAWIKANPEKAAEINDKLTEFLKQRPNLARAIEDATNRYEEAWELMDKLSPKQKAALKPTAAKKDAPGNPSAVPKASGINQTVDVMNMTDSEFNSWRKSQIRKR